MQSLAFHSHKGGVGKTTLAVNCAIELVKHGKRVCLLDNDFAGPSMQTFFSNGYQQYLNEYFEDNAAIEEVIVRQDLQEFDGTLYVGLANPTSDSMEKMVRLDKKLATTMLKKQFNIKKALLQKPYNIDYLLIDTSPGIGITVANSFLLTDHVLFVTKISNADIEGSVTVINGYSEMLDQKSFIIANQVPASKINEDGAMIKLEKLIHNQFSQRAVDVDFEFLGCIANNERFIQREYDSAISRMEGEVAERLILTKENKEAEFVQSIQKILARIF